jgi:hypothetical protein
MNSTGVPLGIALLIAALTVMVGTGAIAVITAREGPVCPLQQQAHR